VSASDGRLVIASGAQGGGIHPPQAHDALVVALVIVAMALLAALIVIYTRRRRRRLRPVTDQWGALVVMGELCPHGWQAQITMYGWGAPMPPDAPPSRAPLVEVEWKRFEEDSERVAAVRRVRSPTVGEALQVMVDDRRSEITLEQIEQAVGEEEDLWWND
jgi:hypothetical protein